MTVRWDYENGRSAIFAPFQNVQVTSRQRRKSARYSSAVAGILVLVGCATPNVGKNYVLSEASGKGVVIGTITSSGQHADYRLFYRKVGGGEEGFFHLMSTDPSLNAALIAAELPAGDYEIYKWLIYWSHYAPFYTTQVAPAEPLSIPFHVAPGDAVYIGSCDFYLLTIRRRNFFGDIEAAGVACSDQSQRDLMELEARYPRVKNAVKQRGTARAEFYRSAGFKAYNLHGEPRF